MLHCVFGSALRTVGMVARNQYPIQHRAMSHILNSVLGSSSGASAPIGLTSRSAVAIKPIVPSLLHPTGALSLPVLQQTPTRTLTKFSLNKGKRKAVKAVLKRFKRLDWGAWIRTKCGRHKKMFKKTPARKRRLRQHVFTNAQQSWLLDKMVTNFWRRPKYYIDDPYEPYHRREDFFATKGKTFRV